MSMNDSTTSRFQGMFDDMRDAGELPGAQKKAPTAAAVTAAVAAVVAAPAPRKGTEGSGTAGPVDAEGRARAIASDGIAAKHGIIARGATLFTWGTGGAWGDAAYKARMELRARPLLSAFAPEVKATVAAEGRRHDAVALPTLTYGVDGRLRTTVDVNGRKRTAPAAGAVMTSHSFRQLLNRADAPGYAAGYLGSEKLPAELRANTEAPAAAACFILIPCQRAAMSLPIYPWNLMF